MMERTERTGHYRSKLHINFLKKLYLIQIWFKEIYEETRTAK